MQTNTPSNFTLADGAGHTFLKRRPSLGLPSPNSGFIALYGASGRSLAGKAQSLEQTPYTGLAISLASERLDQLADPSQCPKVTAVSLRQRACLECVDQALLVIRIQQRWPTSACRTVQASPSVSSKRPLPPHHRRSAYRQTTCNFGRTHATPQQPAALDASGLQLRSV